MTRTRSQNGVFRAIADPTRRAILDRLRAGPANAGALAADFDATSCVSNTFAVEWPKGSGKLQEFPEVDRAEWFDLPTAREKLVKGQMGFLDQLLARITTP